MAQLTAAQLYAVNRAAGFAPDRAVVMTAIQLGESGGRSDAIGDTGLQTGTWGPSVGISQIRTVKAQTGTGGARDILTLSDPLANARAAYQLSNGGQDFTAWKVWNSGAYRRFLGQASAAALGPAADITGLSVQQTGLVDSAVGGALSGLLPDTATLQRWAVTGLVVTAGVVLLVAGAVRTVQPQLNRAAGAVGDAAGTVAKVAIP